MKIIGAPRRRVDGRAKVTGQTRFADDLMLPRMVHCRLLRSTVPHARILRVDASRALAHPGVHLVLTGADFPISYGILPVSQDEHALAVDRVRFVGGPVAAVIARDELTAFEALDLIDVAYEPLRTFSDPRESLACDEPRVHDYGDSGNIHKIVSLAFGDVEQAFARADHVFDDTFFYQGSTHLPIEQHAAVAALDPDGKLVLWSSTQTPHYVHRALAKALRLPAAHIRVIATPNGGGFGGKSDPFHHEVVVCKAAIALDRPDLALRTVEQPETVPANYLRVGTNGLPECSRRVTAAADWRGKFRRLPHGRGVGLACSAYLSGAGLPIYWNDMPHSGVQLKLDRSGGVTAFCGATEIGQGSDDVLVGCVAEVLGIDPLDVRAVTGDTDLTPVDLGSYSSRVTLMMGHAALQAAERARELLAAAVSKRPGVPAARLEFAGNRVFDVQDPESEKTSMTFAEAAVLGEAKWGTLGTVGSYTPPPSAGRFRGAGVGPSPAYSYSAAVVEVDADEDTGVVDVRKVWIAHDIGQAIHT